MYYSRSYLLPWPLSMEARKLQREIFKEAIGSMNIEEMHDHHKEVRDCRERIIELVFSCDSLMAGQIKEIVMHEFEDKVSYLDILGYSE